MQNNFVFSLLSLCPLTKSKPLINREMLTQKNYAKDADFNE
jgi:hypothetical protein